MKEDHHSRHPWGILKSTSGAVLRGAWRFVSSFCPLQVTLLPNSGCHLAGRYCHHSLGAPPAPGHAFSARFVIQLAANQSGSICTASLLLPLPLLLLLFPFLRGPPSAPSLPEAAMSWRAKLAVQNSCTTHFA
ncbi:unnamed protein product [Prorocentrum cordatum]|uniref:Uncharacterized protein n=1 Tax=Prorocentrum cordatum TaxID=2364126 RepID=A0ABN9XC02_9DINO|nr:unnamed protein product [Polarella glacialis]